MRDLTILLDSVQGTPARVLGRLAAAGVDLEAGCLFPRVEGRVLHIAVPDEQVAVVKDAAAAEGGVLADDRECVIVPSDYPGGVGEIALKVAGSGATVQVAYFGRKGQVVLATTDLDKTRAALGLG
jgi:hypothetical protein